MNSIPAPLTWAYFCPICEETEHFTAPIYNRTHQHDIPGGGFVVVPLKLVAKTYPQGVTRLESDGDTGN